MKTLPQEKKSNNPMSGLGGGEKERKKEAYGTKMVLLTNSVLHKI